MPCAAWNDARKGVYSQKRTPGGAPIYYVSKNAVFWGVLKRSHLEEKYVYFTAFSWVSKKVSFFLKKLIDYIERLGKPKASECIERKWLILGNLKNIYRHKNNIYIYNIDTYGLREGRSPPKKTNWDWPSLRLCIYIYIYTYTFFS